MTKLRKLQTGVPDEGKSFMKKFTEIKFIPYIVLKAVMKIIMIFDWVTLKAKILWLAFRVRLHARQVRVFTAKLEAHMAQCPNRMHKERDRFLLEQLRQMREQEGIRKS